MGGAMIAHINGVDIFYTIHGDGMPLMLMHGGMGLDHTCFRPWLDPLSDRIQLIFYDHRGNGRSTRLADFSGVDHTTWADDADALRRHLGHEKIVLLGHSCGGFVAMEYARRYGNHLAGLVLCCTTPAMDYPEVIMANAQARSTPEQLQLVLKAFTLPLTNDDEMRDLYEKILPLYFKSYDPGIGSRIMDAIHFNHHAINYCTSAWFSAFNSLGWLHQITVPTLIISGKDDWIMPVPQSAGRINAVISKPKLLIFENSGHFPFVEEQNLFIKSVSHWVSCLK